MLGCKTKTVKGYPCLTNDAIWCFIDQAVSPRFCTLVFADSLSDTSSYFFNSYFGSRLSTPSKCCQITAMQQSKWAFNRKWQGVAFVFFALFYICPYGQFCIKTAEKDGKKINFLYHTNIFLATAPLWSHRWTLNLYCELMWERWETVLCELLIAKTGILICIYHLMNKMKWTTQFDMFHSSWYIWAATVWCK